MAAATLPYAAPNSYQQWAEDLVAQLDADGYQVPESQANVEDISAWEQAEEPIGSFLGLDNPLNTTLACYGGTTPATFAGYGAPDSANTAGVKNYPSVAAGVEANAATIEGPPFNADILPNLEQGTGAGFASTVGSSGWGSSGSLIAAILGGSGPNTATSTSSDSGATGGTATTTGFNLNPLDLFGIPQTIVGSAASSIWSDVGPFLARALLIVAGLGIVLIGVRELARPATDRAEQLAPLAAAAA